MFSVLTYRLTTVQVSASCSTVCLVLSRVDEHYKELMKAFLLLNNDKVLSPQEDYYESDLLGILALTMFSVAFKVFLLNGKGVLLQQGVYKGCTCRGNALGHW